MSHGTLLEKFYTYTMPQIKFTSFWRFPRLWSGSLGPKFMTSLGSNASRGSKAISLLGLRRVKTVYIISQQYQTLFWHKNKPHCYIVIWALFINISCAHEILSIKNPKCEHQQKIVYFFYNIQSSNQVCGMGFVKCLCKLQEGKLDFQKIIILV